MNEETLEIIDTVRWQIVEELLDQRDYKDSLCRPDYENPSLDYPLDFTND